MSEKFEPAYRQLPVAELARRAAVGHERLRACDLCPRRCGGDRLAGQPAKIGFCRTGGMAQVASYGPHFGEEEPLVGRGGSGTIFFGNCNLGCVFCQNYDISHPHAGQDGGMAVDAAALAGMMLELQEQGCVNINLVTPSHVVPQILAALVEARRQGLQLPLVYNTGSYDSLATLQLLAGVVDIYLADFKYWRPSEAKRLLRAEDYPQRAREAIKEMHRQVGDLKLDGQGLARRGLLLRHLVMPGGLADSEAIFRFLAEDISPHTYTNIMEQYHPAGQAHKFPPIDRPLDRAEYQQALELASQAGLKRLDERGAERLMRRLFRL
ncbi:radical SAM protein [Desulfurivibrio dismutans]|uniref:radical SAM protein n=1 Tax=Desulfurivibrio dismutans TaxID=1398908 RepID=UPI0023DC41D9|nr:radical SAM protein [Desulfurivibrio alkaliphilus]MDF1614195.1 radical SAM protein [Desulfurivibrio alkaliphilus]